jgi:hypothetical protein
MITLMRNGGGPMIFILLFGLVGLATAFWFAVRPSERHVGFIKWMSRATMWSVLCGFSADLAAVFYNTTTDDYDAMPPALFVRIVVHGLAESMSPGIVGFALLSLTALVAAVGQRRLDARKG